MNEIREYILENEVEKSKFKLPTKIEFLLRKLAVITIAAPIASALDMFFQYLFNKNRGKIDIVKIVKYLFSNAKPFFILGILMSILFYIYDVYSSVMKTDFELLKVAVKNGNDEDIKKYTDSLARRAEDASSYKKRNFMNIIGATFSNAGEKARIEKNKQLILNSVGK